MDETLIEGPHEVGPAHPQTAFYLNQRFEGVRRQFAYPKSKSSAVWSSWRVEFKKALEARLGLPLLGKRPVPRPVLLGEDDLGNYLRQRIAYETLPGNWVTAYLLIPRGASSSEDAGGGPRPAVVCPHGHVPGGKESVVTGGHSFGLPYGHELAINGYIVLAPDNAGMGERDIASQDRVFQDIGGWSHMGCLLSWVRLNHIGLDLTGLRVFDLMVGLDLLSHRVDVNPDRLGAVGLSGGGWLSLLLAALDARVQATVVSGIFTTFEQTIWHGHCICHHPFGLGLLAELSDIAALIAPRPLFVESGEGDVLFPLEPAFEESRRAYALLGSSDHLGLDHHPGGHEFRGTLSLPWLRDRLGDAT